MPSKAMPKTVARRLPDLRVILLFLGLTMLALVQQTLAARSAPRATEFMLANGMKVVVIPDTRAPVVTHMVWYRVGAADEPKGVSGIAHFLEHLMFKSTEKIPMGEFSKIVARLGGQDNAFTSHDTTSYFQRVSKDRLRTVMEMEADRMVNLRLTEKEVLTERDVILEERRSRIENNPSSILDEQMDAVLYQNHPYGIPIIGWEHEIAKLSQSDAMSFYKRHYAPNNAVLVVAGDVTEAEVKKLAEETYGKIPRNAEVGAPRVRPKEPPHRAPRRLTLNDARAGKASMSRYMIGPSYSTAPAADIDALDVAMKILGSGSTSRIYKKLVMEEKVASSAGGWFSGGALDTGKLGFYAIAADGATLEKVEASLDAVIADFKANGVTAAELERAKSSLVADFVYQSDSQATLARRYGWALMTGSTLADVDAWPDRIAKVTAEQVQAAAAKYIDMKSSVTGYLIPEADASAAAPAAKPAPAKSRS